MISEDDARRTFMLDDRYVITPMLPTRELSGIAVGKPVPEGFAYRSNTNDLWLGVPELRELLESL
jgi:UDP-N-acetylglucosamine 4,6-dehydratase/5-epimerase